MQATTRYDELRTELRAEPRTWLVTGAAGFIGSHLTEELLRLGQRVRAADDFSTGHRSNLDEVRARLGTAAAERLEVVEGDVGDPARAAALCAGVHVVLHQAALGSVPRSVADPLATHRANVSAFATLLHAAVEAGIGRFVYASSSSVYGDHPDLPKREHLIGEPLSPYAASKRIDEIYAAVFHRTYGIETVGLRYFNVFGPRQDPAGPYAAVIPRWIDTLLAGVGPTVHGDGETSRDFCPVANVVQANLLAASEGRAPEGAVYNVGLGGRTTLNELFAELRRALVGLGHPVGELEASYGPFREGDVRHSLADISKARENLGYAPQVTFAAALEETAAWFVRASAPGDESPTEGA